MIITLTLGSLVALNFLLLIFSCNKSTKRSISENSTVIKSPKALVPTKQIPRAQTQLAPTGS
ncbi:hypothetical protein [Psychroserpens sp.]